MSWELLLLGEVVKTYLAAAEGQVKESEWTVINQLTESHVVYAEFLQTENK